MTTFDLQWHGYRYFSYEKELAIREVAAVTGETPFLTETGLRFSLESKRASEIIRRLTYFRGATIGTEIIVPDQARLEASAGTNGSLWLPSMDPLPDLRRQSTRYSAHGLHEYKGKFNPQLVRVIGNIIGIEPGQWLFDPFCGSGTSLLESAHIGWNALGTDLNPLGVLIGNAKIAAFRVAPRRLEKEADKLISRLSDRRITARSSTGVGLGRVLPNLDYLQQWFTMPVLVELAQIVSAIREVTSENLRSVFRVVLSDICREVSLQDPRDLRIRRRKDPAENYPVVDLFSESLHVKIQSVLRARQYMEPNETRQSAHIADCRTDHSLVTAMLAKHGRRTFDAAICSPPYATALPYIDTQRLSLCLLGLISSGDIRSLEKTLIGNREVGGRERLELEEVLKGNKSELPDDVMRFCRMLLAQSCHSDHGFRKRNVPSLLFKYFLDMRSMFQSVRRLVRKGGRFALVVGSNKTTLQGEIITIRTPVLLSAISESVGWKVEDSIGLDTYQRFDLHKDNSIRDEALVILRNV